jgi:hypothetical protein
MIKSFSEWQKLNEEQVNSDLTEYFDNVWTEIKFPWEDKIVEALETAKETLGMFENYNLNRRRGQGAVANDTVAFDIKYYDGPDMTKVREEYGEKFDEDRIYELFHQYMNEQLEVFIDSIDYTWISDVFQDGRSGGWLVVQFTSDSSPEQIKSDIVYDLEIYKEDTESVEPITKEELHKLRGSLAGKKFGLNESDEPQSRSERVADINYAEKESKTLIESIEANTESAATILKQLKELESLIEAGKLGLKDGFFEYLASIA